jgi:FMN phosphatase YigB (HAD superfamily)
MKVTKFNWALIFDFGNCTNLDVFECAMLMISKKYDIPLKELDRVRKLLWKLYAHFPGTPGSLPSRKLIVHLERQLWTDFIAIVGIKATPAELIELTSSLFRLNPGYRDLLGEIRDNGIALAGASNNTPFWYEHVKDEGLGEFFPRDLVKLSCDFGVSKSSPDLEIFKAVLEAVNVPRECCVYIDDRPGNLRRAMEAGIRTTILHPQDVDWGRSPNG